MHVITAQPIVCGVDGSSESRAAAHFAARLADRLGVRLMLAHVSQVPATFTPPPLGAAALAQPLPGYSEAAREAARETGRGLLREVARELPDRAALELVSGDPAHGLLELADESAAGMVVLGGHGRGALERALTGTLWCRLVAEGRSPVAVVNGRSEVAADGPVVVGYGGSARSERAVQDAAALAERLGARLIVVNVASGASPGLDAATCADADWSTHAAGRRALADAHWIVRRGEPHVELARVAEAEDAALVVTGSRGRGPWRAAVLGSVSANLVSVATRPVLIVSDGAET